MPSVLLVDLASLGRLAQLQEIVQQTECKYSVQLTVHPRAVPPASGVIIWDICGDVPNLTLLPPQACAVGDRHRLGTSYNYVKGNNPQVLDERYKYWMG